MYLVFLNPFSAQIIVKDLPNDHVDTVKYDAVFVCNGHCSTPLMPDIPGMDRFKGVQKHSHDFRDPQKYKGKKLDNVFSFAKNHTETMFPV